MTSQILVRPKYLGKFERHAEEIIPMLLNGVPQREIAAKFDGTLRGLQQFMERHDVDLKQAKVEAVEAVKDLWITNKVKRLEILQEVTEMTLAELREFGITIVEERHETSSTGVETITKTRDFRGTMAKELRGLLKDAAIEEGQIVPASPNKGGLMREVIIREYEGVPQEYIG